MNRRAIAIASGCALAAAVAAGVVALRPPPGAPMSSVPRAAERDVSLPSDWRTELAKAVAGDDGAFREAVRRGLARDPGATLDAVARLAGLAERAKWALSLWLEADPKAARDWAAGLAEAEGRALLVDAFDLFAARDAAAALAAAGALPDGGDRALLAARALGVWARADPATAWLAAQDLALPGDRAGRKPEPKTIRAAVAQWLSEDFDAGAWKRRRGRLSTAVLDVWAEGGWREPLAAVAATAGAHVPDDWQEAAIARWAEAEPLTALEWASSLPRFDAAARVKGVVSRGEALGTALATMAIHWPHKANAAMEEIGDWRSRDRQDIYNSGGYRDAMARFVEATDPRRLAAWFDNQPDAGLRSRHAADVARAYAAAHPQEALEWTRRLPEGHLERTRAVWGAVTTIADGDHERAAAMLVDIGDADLVKTLARRLLTGWAKEDPLAALRWTETHAPKEWDAKRRMALFNPWAYEDPVAAAAHLPEIADADERAWATHYAINGTFRTASRDDEALRPHLPRIERLYATLPSEARSKHVAYFLYRHYERTDPQRAARYRAEAGDDHGDPWNFSGIYAPPRKKSAGE